VTELQIVDPLAEALVIPAIRILHMFHDHEIRSYRPPVTTLNGWKALKDSRWLSTMASKSMTSSRVTSSLDNRKGKRVNDDEIVS
jgi:hypothetical protein